MRWQLASASFEPFTRRSAIERNSTAFEAVCETLVVIQLLATSTESLSSLAREALGVIDRVQLEPALVARFAQFSRCEKSDARCDVARLPAESSEEAQYATHAP